MDLNEIWAAADRAARKYTTKADSVRWTAWKEDGLEISKWKNTACYGTAMQTLPELETHCLPQGGPSKGQMPAVWYHHFFRLLKQHGLVPPEVRTLHRNGANCLIIPRTGWDRHTIYIALCYYRQCDQRPNEIMRAMLLWKKLASQGTHFLQCLHYTAITTSFGPGHYFMNFGAYGGSDKLDLASGGALAWFAKLSKEERQEFCPFAVGKKKQVPYDDSIRSTNSFLAAKAKEMESIRVAEPTELLNPKYAKYYENPSLARKE